MLGFESKILGIILASGFTIKLVLLVLLFFSVLSWAIIFYKFSLFKKAFDENKAFLSLYWKIENLIQLRKSSVRFKQSPLVKIFLSGLDRINSEALTGKTEPVEAQTSRPRSVSQLNIKMLERAMRRTGEEQLTGFERHLSFLATTGNVSPFIGLFGTVLGIIDAFHEIGRQGSANIAAVAPGLSEALIATAAGLLVAIPAVVAFNYYISRVRYMGSEIEGFSADFLTLIEEQYKTSTIVETR